ncbi:PREDICTED: protein LOL2 isoform X2 [Nelumbo nucifera]|uniref:Protein LOL2 isoform X2 n=1 Tax=Nelumbo nucifera TaxID=4432 RepID=A0A1U7YRT6_NELNU|nr:PREDICTED: protein LOL2 isoform X2 [Nelumbo nucifera]
MGSHGHLTDAPPPRRQTTPPSPEMGQMVCGTCRCLLSYPRGVRYVKCAQCRTVNLLLEAHQVGQVKCGNCSVLLMYPYGAPSVKCSCCHSVTEIGRMVHSK